VRESRRITGVESGNYWSRLEIYNAVSDLSRYIIKNCDQEKALSEGEQTHYRSGVRKLLVKTGDLQCSLGSFKVNDIRNYTGTCQGNGVSDELLLVNKRKKIGIEA